MNTTIAERDAHISDADLLDDLLIARVDVLECSLVQRSRFQKELDELRELVLARMAKGRP